MKRWAGATLVVFIAWSLYLVPTAALLDVGYGPDGFRRFGPRYSAVRVIEVEPPAVVKVRAALPPGTVVTMQTQRGASVGVKGEVASEVETPQEWHFDMPEGDDPFGLVVLTGKDAYRWEFEPTPRFVSFPWWFRLAPPWAKRWHIGYAGLSPSSLMAPSGESHGTLR